MRELFSLGKIYPSDFIKPGEKPRCKPYDIKLMLNDDGVAVLSEQPPSDQLWGQYWYRSSISETMRNQLKNVVKSVTDVKKMGGWTVWVDAAGNDGFLLSQVPKGVLKINIDPADDTYKEEAEKHCDLVIQDFFSEKVYRDSIYGRELVDIISCVSMFYDLKEPGKFLDDAYGIMHKDGLLCLQMSYTPLMLEQLELSNLCHEHWAYYSFFNLKNLLEKHRFKVMDVQLNDTNAGSFLVHAMKNEGDINIYSSVVNRDVCNFRIKSLLAYEHTLGLTLRSTWFEFFNRINERKRVVMEFLIDEIENGKIIFGYGASTKAATLCQYFGIDKTILTAIADKSEYKHGLRTVGTDIPIVSEEEMRLNHPDYLIIFPFHFLNEFLEREKDYLAKGGKFITILPEFKIIGND